jgi:hypothetical protein
VSDLREELSSLSAAISGEKYLRTVIMWNRMKPNETIEQVSKKAEREWLVPSFLGCSCEAFKNFVTNNTSLKVLEIEGDSGVKKILHMIRVLRYGEGEAASRNSKVSASGGGGYHLLTFPGFNGSTVNAVTAGSQSLTLQQSPGLFSPGRRASTKKLEVLSTLEQFKANTQSSDNDQ